MSAEDDKKDAETSEENSPEESSTAEPESEDIEKLLDKREELDALFKNKFTKMITVMFTDLKGSTSITEKEGDMSGRILIKRHNSIVFPIIKKNSGILVKTMGDGTMSYFENAQGAVCAAVGIQQAVDEENITKEEETPMLVRIGINTGKGIVEKDDIYGDVVNVASRFESISNPSEIYISESTYDALDNATEIYCRYVKTAKLKGKEKGFRVYKAFWDPAEIEADKKEVPEERQEKLEVKGSRLTMIVKLFLTLLIPLIVVLVLMKIGVIFNTSSSVDEETRAVSHSVTIPGDDTAPDNDTTGEETTEGSK